VAAANPAHAHTLDLASVGQFRIQLLSAPIFTRIGSARSAHRAREQIAIPQIRKSVPIQSVQAALLTRSEFIGKVFLTLL
jgi:hypothetical protein